MTLIEEAVNASVLSRNEAAERLARAAAGRASDSQDGLPHQLRPDAAAARCLDLITMPLGEARDLTHRWQQQPIDVIRQLREVKHLVTAVSYLRPYVRDPDLAARADGWIAVRPELP